MATSEVCECGHSKSGHYIGGCLQRATVLHHPCPCQGYRPSSSAPPVSEPPPKDSQRLDWLQDHPSFDLKAHREAGDDVREVIDAAYREEFEDVID